MIYTSLYIKNEYEKIYINSKLEEISAEIFDMIPAKRTETVRDAILDEWDALCQEGISADELRAIKGNYTGTLARRFETNLSVAGIFGIEGLLHRVEPFDEAIARIEAVTQSQALDAARRYLNDERYVLATVGK